MKGIILYQSRYGSTKKYAEWLSEETGFDIKKTKEVKADVFDDYDVIILGGGVYASGVLGLSFFKKNINKLKNKKAAVFCVGASPYDEKAISQAREHNFKGEMQNIPLFYCRGAWDEEKMTFSDRTLCRMLHKAVKKQDPDTYEPWQKALLCAVGQKCDWSHKKYLEPLIEYINK